MSQIVNILGAILTLLFGIWAMLKPIQFSKFISLTPYKNQGITEIRATYGGWISALAIFALYYQSNFAFHCLGFGWMGAAVTRIISLYIDNSYTSKNLKFIIGEIAIGVLLLM